MIIVGRDGRKYLSEQTGSKSPSARQIWNSSQPVWNVNWLELRGTDSPPSCSPPRHLNWWIVCCGSLRFSSCLLTLTGSHDSSRNVAQRGNLLWNLGVFPGGAWVRIRTGALESWSVLRSEGRPELGRIPSSRSAARLTAAPV